MNAAEAYQRLRRLGLAVVDTADAAALWGQSPYAASKTLGRLGDAGLVRRLRHGVWLVDAEADRLTVATHFARPFPSYVSLQTALQHHGLIEQIPIVIYLVSLGRTRKIRSADGAVSIHHTAPELYGGFVDRGTYALATPEKAVFDVAYLSGTRSRLFAALPELELPPRFRRAAVEAWVAKIGAPRVRTRVERRLVRWGVLRTPRR